MNSDDKHITKLINGCLKGKSKYQELLYKEFYGYGLKICIRYSYSYEEAVEIFNDSFLKVFDKLHLYDWNRSFKGWLAKIIVNTAIDYYRRSKRLNSSLDVVENEGDEFDISGIQSLEVQDILNLLNGLNEIYRVTFNMYEIEGFSHEEIAEKMGVSTSTSRSNLTRAKRKLRELYREYNRTNHGAAI